jgi:hypothetical protein
MSGSSVFNDLWEWNGSAWSQPVWNGSGPTSGRRWHATAYDRLRRRMVVFGGTDTSGAVLDETWSWAGTTRSWTMAARNPAGWPGVRAHAGMVFDESSGTTVLFGGLDGGSAVLEDTWVWDGAAWNNPAPAHHPSGRSRHAMVFERPTGRIMLWGGYNQQGCLADAWVWDRLDWRPLTTAGAPSGRFAASMVYDASRQRAVLFGGNDGAADLCDTWLFDGGAAPVPFRSVAEPVVGAHTLIGTRCLAAAVLGTADAVPDLAVGVSVSGSSYVRILQSAGWLSSGLPDYATWNLPTGDDPVDCLFVDVIGNSGPDGVLDLAVLCGGDHTLYLFKGTDASAPVGYTLALHDVLPFGFSGHEMSPVDVEAADFDRDGDLDLAVAFQGSLFTGGSVVILANDGLGGFTRYIPAVAMPIGSAMGLAAGDFDGDTLPDLAVSDGGATGSGGTVKLFWGETGGLSGANAVTIPVRAAPRGLHASDLDLDGHLDLVVACFGLPGFGDEGAVVTIHGDGNWTGALDRTISPASAGRSGPALLAAGDLGGDSDPEHARNDVVVVNLASGNFTTLLECNRSMCSYRHTHTAANAGTVTSAIVTDLDGDTVPEIVVGTMDQGVKLYRGVVDALAQTYGTGCAGHGNQIPAISALGTPPEPTIGNLTFGIELAEAKPFTLGLLLWGIQGAPLQPCHLLLAPVGMLSSFTSAAGGASLPVAVPPAAGLVGYSLYFQWAILDGQGQYMNAFALSEVLRARVGY